MSPGWKKEWHVGVRAGASQTLVAFISAIPVKIRLRENSFLTSEVNFLCVHKKLRGKRLTPILIKEVTRRSNLSGIWQGLYTAGVVLPTPVSTCRYFHRAINWQKLYEVGFSPLPAGSKPTYQVRKYSLPDKTAIKGLREMEARDVEGAFDLFERYMTRYDMAVVYTPEEFAHWFLHDKSGTQVIWSYVVEVSSAPTHPDTPRRTTHETTNKHPTRMTTATSPTSFPSTASSPPSLTAPSIRTSALPTCGTTPPSPASTGLPPTAKRLRHASTP